VFTPAKKIQPRPPQTWATELHLKVGGGLSEVDEDPVEYAETEAISPQLHTTSHFYGQAGIRRG
jgi:hypothetical protein